MGLTIHWSLRAPEGWGETEIKDALSKLRDFALTLPLKEVSDVLYFAGDDANYSKGPKDDPHKWLKSQAQNYDEKAMPTKFYALSTWPGEGCEGANFGLGFYADSNSWTWSSFCKTQYSEDFAGCHLAVITLLDFCKKLGFLERVSDEGDYWETRDLKKLAGNINQSTDMLKALSGVLKGVAGSVGLKTVAPIDDSENYMDVK